MRLRLFIVVLAACGGAPKQVVAEPKPATPQPPPADDEEASTDDGVGVEGTLGQLDPDRAQPTFEAHSDLLQGCFTDQKPARFVGGQVEIKFHVLRDGTVKWVGLTMSDLGAWPIEKCLWNVSMGMTFPKPHGGEAEVSFPVNFPATAPTIVKEDTGTFATALATNAGKLKACKGAPPRALTVYVGPGGKVQSAGFATMDQPITDDVVKWADCAVPMVLAWKLADPRGMIVKATAAIP
jgi:hypothetical protein